jgi:hypothetical protein
MYRYTNILLKLTGMEGGAASCHHNSVVSFIIRILQAKIHATSLTGVGAFVGLGVGKGVVELGVCADVVGAVVGAGVVGLGVGAGVCQHIHRTCQPTSHVCAPVRLKSQVFKTAKQLLKSLHLSIVF